MKDVRRSRGITDSLCIDVQYVCTNNQVSNYLCIYYLDSLGDRVGHLSILNLSIFAPPYLTDRRRKPPGVLQIPAVPLISLNTISCEHHDRHTRILHLQTGSELILNAKSDYSWKCRILKLFIMDESDQIVSVTRKYRQVTLKRRLRLGTFESDRGEASVCFRKSVPSSVDLGITILTNHGRCQNDGRPEMTNVRFSEHCLGAACRRFP
jgi:hypothetical protein